MFRRDFLLFVGLCLVSSPALGQQNFQIGYPSSGSHFAKTANVASYGVASDQQNFPNNGMPVVIDIVHVSTGQTMDSRSTTTGTGGYWAVTLQHGGTGWPQTGECKVRLYALGAIRKEVTITIDP